MPGPIAQLVTQPSRALPVLTYPGAAVTGTDVLSLVTGAAAQTRAQLALGDRYPLTALMTCMDLSVEAEAFGCEIQLSATEVPTVIGRRVVSREALTALPQPTVGTGRTPVYLETARRLRAAAGNRLVLGGMIGPFSLAARLHGVSEALSLTLTDPEFMHAITKRATDFLIAYAAAFREAGAHGVIMAEPTAGLLSPKGLAEFSGAYVRKVVQAVQSDDFSVVLHNCAARLAHLAPSLEAGSHALHFGSPMDLSRAVKEVAADRLILGNLDPAAVLVQGTPDQVANATRTLLAEMRGHTNFVISSGCDLPPETPVANLDAFFATVARETNP
ncbi:MAG: uroporphyrinogen decarboxylase family protein [Verrucomicrobiales bacterium]|nr:uroporphyrinogen decarboxylase family protein [Verrucomicrobiales bacterium]